MTWVTLLVVALAIAFMVMQFRGGLQPSTTVPDEYRVPVPAGGLDAVEYFWRPG